MTSPAALPGPAPDRVRVLGVFAHPDDETITGGGLLALLAPGSEVTVVTSNRGERGDVIPDDLAALRHDGPALAAVREQELAGALRALGVQHHTYLDALPGLAGLRPARITDSGMRWEGGAHRRALAAPDAAADAFTGVEVDIAARLLAALVRRLRPHLVLTDEPDGGYGHPDHVHAHLVTMRAVEVAASDHESRAPDDPSLADQPWRVPVVAWLVQKESTARAALRWLATHPARPATAENGATLSVPDPDEPLPSVVRPDGEVDLEVDVSAVAGRVVDALRAHRSQVHAVTLDPAHVGGPGGDPAAGWFALSNDVLHPVRTRSGLAVAPGWGERASLVRVLDAATAPAGRPDAPGWGAAPAAEPPADPRWYGASMVAFSAVLGVMVAAAGTVFHRAMPPWGVLIALVAVLAGGVLCRTFADRRGLVAYGVVVISVVVLMTYLRPGGDVLVTDEPIGTVWLFGSMVGAVAGALVPRQWFRG